MYKKHCKIDTTYAIIFTLWSLAFSGACMSQEHVKLWPESMPVEAKSSGKEYIKENRAYNIREPELVAYFPSNNNSNRKKPAVLIFPGGSYGRLAIIKEGEKTALLLNKYGIVAFVVKNRVKEFGAPAPLLDGLRALQLVRESAEKWGIDANKIGICGFSAGGHLAASISTHHTNSAFFKEHDLQRYGLNEDNSKPNFAALIYPATTMQSPYGHEDSKNNLLGVEPSQEEVDFYSTELHVNETTPPTFLVHGDNDAYVDTQNSLIYYQALRKNNVPAELHILQNGPHGMGLGQGLTSAQQWPSYLIAWLKENNILETD